MFSRTKTFCFENFIFLTFGLGMREGVGEDSKHGIGLAYRHSSRIMYFLECVWLPLYVHLGGEYPM